MKSKKMLAQIAAFSLVFGMTGVVSSWADNTADEVVVKGTTVEQYDPLKCVKVDNTLVDKATDDSLSITGKDVRGIWLTDGAKLTANNVNFNDKGTANEVGLDSASKLIMKGGSIKVPGVAFTADGGSTATTDGTTIETGVLASNSTIILKNSTTTGVALYAGNEFGQGKVEEGLPVGTLTIDGGKANVKNALVQNKGSMTVTNGAVLDLTGDLSATDEYTQAATGIKKGGEIVVRAWEPNTAQAEKENSDTINKLDKATALIVNGKSTIEADTIDVTGNSYNGHIDRAKLEGSESSTVTANTMNVGKYGYTNFKDSQLTVNGKLSVTGAADGPTSPNPVGVEMHGGSAMLNEVNVNDKGYMEFTNTTTTANTIKADDSSIKVNDGSNLITNQMKLTNGSTVTVDGTNSSYTIKGTDNTVSGGSTIKLNGDAELNLKDLTLQDGGELYANWRSTVNADTISVEDGAKFQGVGRSTINVNNLRIGSNPGRIRVRGTFEGRVTDLNGNSLSKQQVKESFLLPTGDKTSLEFQAPEVDHTLVLHMNEDGALTMQGKDFSQADTGNTRTYIMASWSANGDYNAEGHDIKNVNSLSANRLVINGTDITDSLGGAVDVSGKADTSLGNLTDEGKKVIRNTMKGDLDTKADATTVTEELAKKADAETMTTALSQKAQASDLAQLQKGANIDKAAWQSSLGDGKNVAGNTGLITGDTLYQALQGISTTGTVYKAGKHITIDKDNTIMVNTDGKVTAGDTGIVTGGQVQEAISKATEGIATNVANKADKNLSNLSDAGKEAIKNTVKADLMGKADTSYVDEKVKDKVNTSDFTVIKDKVDAHETALAGKADKSYVDAAVKKATEGVATDVNVANKADKDLGNLSEAGKNVIKETMKDDLAAKADKTYVDGALDKKANAADVYTKTDTDKKIEDSLTDVNKAVDGKADKADVEKLGQKVDQNVSELKANKADAKASNIDVAAYTNKLNTGKVEDGNKGLVSGGAVWSAINEVKNNTGAGLVTVKGDTVTIASDADATKVSVAGKNGDRVLTGVKTDEKDASSAANVGYVNSTAISLTDSMNAMNSKLSDDIKNAGAVGAALAGLHHLDYDPDNKLDVAVAAGNYRGKSATAMGLFYQPNEMMMVSAGATIGADDNAYNVGLSFKVGKGQTGLTTSKAAMSQEIKELKAAKKESDQKMAAQDEEIRALKEQVAMLVKEMKLSNTVEKDMKK